MIPGLLSLPFSILILKTMMSLFRLGIIVALAAPNLVVNVFKLTNPFLH